MIQAILTILLIILFFILGHFTQAFKKLIGFLTKWFLKIVSFFGFKISVHEKSLGISDEFKNTYKDIKVVKLSKKNIKQKSSIDWVYFSIFLVVGLLVILNLNSITGNAISNWLFTLQPIGIIKTATDMNTFYTATLFSVLSFSGTKVMARWKETKQQRVENKQALLKLRATKLMSSKELIEKAQEKDEQKYKELK